VYIRRMAHSRSAGINQRHQRSCGLNAGKQRCSCQVTWVAEVGAGEQGKRIRRSFSSYAAAVNWRVDQLQAKQSNRLNMPGDQTIGEAAGIFLNDLDVGRAMDRSGAPYKPSTVRDYRRSLELHIVPLLGDCNLGSVERSQIQAIVDRWHRDGLSASRIRNRLMPLRVIYRMAVERDVVKISPVDRVVLPRVIRNRQSEMMKPADIQRLILALPNTVRAIYAVAAYAGLRRGEIRGLRWKNVNLAERFIRVEAAWDDEEGEITPKSAAGYRRVPIIEPLRAELIALRSRVDELGLDWANPDALVFPSSTSSSRPFTSTNVRRQANAAWAVQGVSGFKLHEGRHFAASAMIAAGASIKDVQTALGHADSSVTLDVYGHLMSGALDDLRERMDQQFAS